MVFNEEKSSENLFQDLIGCWKIDPGDIEAIKKYGSIHMIFDDEGNLRYEIRESDKLQIINLTYKVTDNFLITNQPGAPAEEKTEFILEDNKLILIYSAQRSVYLKVK